VSELLIPEARNHLSEVVHEATGGEAIYLTEDGRRLAAVVPVDVAAAIEAAEMAGNFRAVQVALAASGQPISTEKLIAPTKDITEVPAHQPAPNLVPHQPQ